jgi:hypothetical protein
MRKIILLRYGPGFVLQSFSDQWNSVIRVIGGKVFLVESRSFPD